MNLRCWLTIIKWGIDAWLWRVNCDFRIGTSFPSRISALMFWTLIVGPLKLFAIEFSKLEKLHQPSRCALYRPHPSTGGCLTTTLWRKCRETQSFWLGLTYLTAKSKLHPPLHVPLPFHFIGRLLLTESIWKGGTTFSSPDYRLTWTLSSNSVHCEKPHYHKSYTATKLLLLLTQGFLLSIHWTLWLSSVWCLIDLI